MRMLGFQPAPCTVAKSDCRQAVVQRDGPEQGFVFAGRLRTPGTGQARPRDPSPPQSVRKNRTKRDCGGEGARRADEGTAPDARLANLCPPHPNPLPRIEGCSCRQNCQRGRGSVALMSLSDRSGLHPLPQPRLNTPKASESPWPNLQPPSDSAMIPEELRPAVL
jgi:hypothetical protein